MAGAYRGVPHTRDWKRARLDRVAAQMRQRNARVVKIRATMRRKAIAACDREIAERREG